MCRIRARRGLCRRCLDLFDSLFGNEGIYDVFMFYVQADVHELIAGVLMPCFYFIPSQHLQRALRAFRKLLDNTFLLMDFP